MINLYLSINDTKFYFDYQNGKYGFNTDPNRGADTFVPFSENISIVAQIQLYDGEKLLVLYVYSNGVCISNQSKDLSYRFKSVEYNSKGVDKLTYSQ